MPFIPSSSFVSVIFIVGGYNTAGAEAIWSSPGRSFKSSIRDICSNSFGFCGKKDFLFYFFWILQKMKIVEISRQDFTGFSNLKMFKSFPWIVLFDFFTILLRIVHNLNTTKFSPQEKDYYLCPIIRYSFDFEVKYLGNDER